MKKTISSLCPECNIEMTFCKDCGTWICTNIDCGFEDEHHFAECGLKLDGEE